MKIGLDLDGVVVNSLPQVIKVLDSCFAQKFAPGDHFDLSRYYGAPRDEISLVISERAEEMFGAAEMTEGAAAGIAALEKNGHEIIYVTARKAGREEEVTRAWLARRGLGHSPLFCVSGGSKADVVLAESIEVFVDDFLRNAEQISAVGVPVLLLDAFYNQAEEVPPGVTRCNGWEDIQRAVAALAARKPL
ncbi:MAG: hypothetical protein LBH21_05395 [Gracilibacteraceae bacterium]|jgi:uncharacterized HAD superfamily protein|nr:hypothetical protein [Gracilibacteraceae bacterium]